MLKVDRFWWALLALIPALFVFIFFIWPVLSLIFTGITEDGRLEFQSIAQILQRSRTWGVVGQTLLQAFSATALSVLVGIPAAFILYRLQFPGRKALRALLTVPFVLPTVVVAAAFMALYGPGGMLNFLGLDRTFVVLIMALTFFNVTVVMRIVGGFWENLDPRQTEAARMLGASSGQAFLNITLPRLWRPIASAASLVFLFCATSFGVVFVLGGKKYANIETEIYRSTMQLLDLKTSAVLSILQIIIVVLALYFSSRLRRSTSSVSSVTDRVVAFRSKDHLSILLIFIITIALLHALPIYSLISRSFRSTAGDWSFENYLLLFSPPESSPLAQGISGAIWLSLSYALIAMLASVLLGLITVFVVTRKFLSRRVKRGQSVYEYTMMMPLGVSAVTLGLGLLITMHKPFGIGIDLRSTLVLIPIAQTLIALPLVIRTLMPRLQNISQRTKDAGIMLGASPWKVILTIELPLLKNAVAIAAGFAFAASLGEFGAAAFLVRSNDKTLPVIIAQLLSHQDPMSHNMGIAAAVLLGAITASVMVAAESLSLKSKVGWVAW